MFNKNFLGLLDDFFGGFDRHGVSSDILIDYVSVVLGGVHGEE